MRFDAGKSLRHSPVAWRIRAHEVFDELWLTGRMKRREAYAWLARELGLSGDQCHIHKFSPEKCRRVISLARRKLEEE